MLESLRQASRFRAINSSGVIVSLKKVEYIFSTLQINGRDAYISHKLP